MTRKSEIFIISLFLVIIYVVPGVQTGYEYATNPGHRIQMFDLVEDLLVTPMKKANADHAALEALRVEADSLAAEIKAAQAMAGDTTGSWSSERAEELADGISAKAQALETSVLDYNRHVRGKSNVYVHGDTVKPYFRTLRKLRGEIKGVSTMVLDGEDPAAIGAAVAGVQSDIEAAVKYFGGKKGLKDYPAMCLVALRRIMVGNKYLRPYEKDMEKSSVFANTIRPWLQFSYYALYTDLGDKGILGRNEWFFYRPDVEYLTKPYVYDKRCKVVDPNDTPIRDDIIDTIVSFKNRLAERGTDLLLVIMPGKPSVYPDLLTPEMRAESACTFSHSLRMMKELNAAGVETVDLFAAFAQERTRDAEVGDSLYLHTDTHFRNRGVRVTAKTIADRVKHFAWYAPGTTEYVADSVMVPRLGDVGEMTKLSAVSLHMLKFSFPSEATRCYQVYQVSRDEAGNETGRTLYRDDYRSSQILVIGDSFSRIYQTDEPRSAGWISHLALELGQPVASIVSDGGASTLVREMLARKSSNLKNKKLVVWEIVERDFRFGEEGWKDVPLEIKDEI